MRKSRERLCVRGRCACTRYLRCRFFRTGGFGGKRAFPKYVEPLRSATPDDAKFIFNQTIKRLFLADSAYARSQMPAAILIHTIHTHTNTLNRPLCQKARAHSLDWAILSWFHCPHSCAESAATSTPNQRRKQRPITFLPIPPALHSQHANTLQMHFGWFKCVQRESDRGYM